MKRTEFPRCTPESVGIPSAAVARFIDCLNDGCTEMHSLIIMRHGKVCAEGWWAPYAPGLRHTMMSQTKTFNGTAIAIAEAEGLLSLDERLVDIFPEYVPENPSENLQKMTIRHLLCMGGGMETTCKMDENWLKNFFATPVPNEPGTAFFYNDSAVTVLPAIIRKKTGLHIVDFLRPRLFDKIGIDADNITWFNVADGTAFGAGGLHCTTEDALRLMKLYADGGVWEGEQIIPADYVKTATQVQNATARGYDWDNGLKGDNVHGYGYMMWMGSKPGTYRAEGAYGQITLVDPSLDIIISTTECSPKPPASQETMDRIWEFLEEIDPNVDALPEDTESSDALTRKLSHLSLAKPPYAPFGTFPKPGETYRCESGVHPENLFYEQVYAAPVAQTITGITEFSFRQAGPRMVEMAATVNGNPQVFSMPTDGSRALHTLPEYYKSLVYVSGYWQDENTFAVRFRWIETVFEKELAFCFDSEGCTISEKPIAGRWRPGTLSEPIRVTLV